MKQLTFRLKSGQLLKEEIESRTKNVEAGVLLSVVGALENATLRMAGATIDHQDIRNIPGPLEIVSGTGTISKDGCHIHIAVADKDSHVFGGHLKDGCTVGVTVEVVIGIFDDVVYVRSLDQATGFEELNVQ